MKAWTFRCDMRWDRLMNSIFGIFGICFWNWLAQHGNNTDVSTLRELRLQGYWFEEWSPQHQGP